MIDKHRKNGNLGKIQSVDTGTVSIRIKDENILNTLQVNQLLYIESAHTGEKIIALINRIMRKSTGKDIEEADKNQQPEIDVENLVKAQLIGTWYEKSGSQSNKFKRSLDVVPSIGSESFVLEDDKLTEFMGAVSSNKEDSLELGKYTIQKETSALLNGNKFFQRHALIVGSTGSGKSWTIANILAQAAKLSSVNNIIFDLHGEYQPLSELDNTTTLKIAGPSDTANHENLLFLPYWLLSYEEIEALILDRSDNNAPNQARALFDSIIKYKKENLDTEKLEQETISDNFTIDSPIPYDIKHILEYIEGLDTEMVPGAKGLKQGPLYGKFTRLIQRLKSKQSDKRLNFIFNNSQELLQFNWLEGLVNKLMCFGGEKNKGSKIIDFSEVPSDILPLITGLVARLIFSVQQWTGKEIRHPIALFCDEAHLYIPQSVNDSIDLRGLSNFERISKEGRKYGISLVVISQRPADLSTTVLSQCNNFIAMRLTNPDDQNVIKRLFPDNLGGFADLLPMLDIGECIIVGDACLLPSRIKVTPPEIEPSSSTIDIWTEWGKTKYENGLSQAVQAFRQQSKN